MRKLPSITRLFLFCLTLILSLQTFAPGQSIDVLLQRAKDAIEKKEYDAALRDLNTILSDKPKNIDALTQRARVFYFLKKFDEAQADANTVIGLNPKKSAIVWNISGLIQSEKKDFRTAIDFFTRSLNVDPAYAKALYNRATAKRSALAAKQTADSVSSVLADYDAFLKFEPQNINAVRDAGIFCLDMRGEYAVCARYFQTIKTLTPDSWVGYYGYAYAHANVFGTVADKEKLKGEIVENFRRAMELNPKNYKIPEQLGRLQFDLGQYDEAINSLTQSLALKPDNDWALAMRGDSYHFKKDYDRAVADYTKSLEIDPKNTLVYKLRAISLRDKGIARQIGFETEQDKAFWQQVADDYRKFTALGSQSEKSRNELALFLTTIPPNASKARVVSKESAQLGKELYNAVVKKDTKTALELIKNGAQINYLGGEYNTSTIYEAAATKDAALVTALLEAGASPDLNHPLYKAVFNDDVPMVALLIKYKADVNAVYNSNNSTILMAAVTFAKNENIVKMLLEAGADKSAVNKEGETALMNAERFGNVKAAVLLGGSADSTAEAVRQRREDADERANIPVREAVAAYERVHKEVEERIKTYAVKKEKLNNAGEAAYLYKGTQAEAQRALRLSVLAIEQLLDKHGRYLPKDLYDHIVEDYRLVGGVKNY